MTLHHSSLITPSALFVTGNEQLGLILRHASTEEENPYGLLLYRPGRTTRVTGTLLFHTEQGLARTALTVIVDGVRYRPRHDSITIEWDEPVEHGVIVARWQAGAMRVEERFSVDGETLVRSVTVVPSNDEGSMTDALLLELALYANPLLFSSFSTDTSGLHADGYEHLTLETTPQGHTFERFITVSVPQSGEVIARYRTNGREEERSTSSTDYTSRNLEPRNPISTQCAIARNGLRASIDGNGRFLASLMQYEFAWGLDAAMVASGAAMLGEDELARRVLGYTLDHLVNDEGMVAEADRFRDGELAELNGNGAVLRAALDVVEWTGDAGMIESRWERIAAVADYLLRPEFQHLSGLLVNRRDFWERTPWMGVQPGAELGHQVFGVVGLRAAAQLAHRFGSTEQAARWSGAATRIEEATLHSSTHPLVEEECFIKRRGVDGVVQRTITADPDWFDPEYAPYLPPRGGTPGESVPWEPDAVTALPIAYGLISSGSLLASNTLDQLEALWDPTGTGGYARYNIAADIDSPGAWPFATMWIAAAQLEAGRLDDAARSIRWLLDAAGPGGAWREFTGTRSTPPFPPVGIIVWAWAQWGTLVVRHMLGARIEKNTLVIAPRLAGLHHTLRVRGVELEIVVEGLERATLDGEPLDIADGVARLSLPLASSRSLRFL